MSRVKTVGCLVLADSRPSQKKETMYQAGNFFSVRYCCLALLLVLTLPLGRAHAAPGGARPDREYRRGAVNKVEDLPPGRLRSRLDQLPPPARQRGIEWLNRFHFTDHDLESLHADEDGAIYYADEFTLTTGSEESGVIDDPQVEEAAVPISPFPPSLVFHSKPGSPNVLFLNFAGDVITGTAWNTSLGRLEIVAVPFSKDSDYETFSDTEQAIIKKVWQRVAEDYAPFDIDVTTERPAAFDSHTGHAIITRNTDANGQPNPSSAAGGVAYVNVFGGNLAKYNPAWVYNNNLSSEESYIAEAVSHEVGHTMGLSHDGQQNGASYYSGHGSGDTSWGPIMGTGYNRNVSQWSKGEYYQANNTQDDLDTIAGKLSYRADDHGETSGTATPLEIGGAGEIVSTTPEFDPENSNAANKGTLERNSDVDCFSFVTGPGEVTLTVDSWIVPSGRTRGGNVDLEIELEDAAGVVLALNNSADETRAEIQATLTEGLYVLRIRNTGVGNPQASPPSGYTSYGSIGQYFISGTVVPTSFAPPPMAEMLVENLTEPDQTAVILSVIYSDDAGIDVSTIDGADLLVNGPDGISVAAQFVSLDAAGNGTPRTATYHVTPPDGGEEWTATGNGSYSVWLQGGQVSDVDGNWIEPELLGMFVVDAPTALYVASMDLDPGWSKEALWEHGSPAYSNGTVPSSGATGTKIMAYNLSGHYEDSLTATYATTPAIEVGGSRNLLLRFQRWLRVRNGDTASIQVTTNGLDWSDLWASSGTVLDSSWQLNEIALPDWVEGAGTVQVRWGMASGPSQSEIGWNIDDVELLGWEEAPDLELMTVTVAVNNPLWGQVSLSSNSYPMGTIIQIAASPAQYFSFGSWRGDITATENPLLVNVSTNLHLEAVFAENVTSLHGTPHWWLEEQGFSEDFEMAAEQSGSNGVPLWQSYVAGLDPADPESRFVFSAGPASEEGSCVLLWDPIPGRVYTVLSSPESAGTFLPVPGAANLPDTVQSFTNAANPNLPAQFYRLEVSLP